MNNPFVGGLIGRLGANEVQRDLDQHIHDEESQGSLFHKLHTTICEILEDIRVIANHFRALQEPPIDKIIPLQTAKRTKIETRGRKYNMVFLGNNTTQIQASIPGLGNVAFTPAVGWTELDFENGTELSLVTGNDMAIMFRCTNVPLGANVL